MARRGSVDDGSADLLAATLRPVLSAGPVVLACSDELARALRAGLPEDAVVVVEDSDLLQGRTPDALAAYTALLDRHGAAQGARVQLVTDGGGHHPDVTAWVQTEALLNHVLADRAVDHWCLLDPADLGAHIDLAVSCHGELLEDTGVVPNPTRRDPADVLGELDADVGPHPLEATPPAVDLTDVDDMPTMRRVLRTALAGGPLSADAAEDLVLAIDELTANAAEHGVPPVDVRLWTTPERVLCSITDRGTGFDEPLAGYGPAHGADLSVGGMGLWLARRAVDRLTTAPRLADGSGCVVRLELGAPLHQDR